MAPNAFIADHHIRHRILDHAHPRVQELFFWHFAEEIEHKSVAFDALSEMTSSRFIRFVGLLLGGCNFVFLLLTGAVWIQFHTSRNWKRFLIEGYQFFLGQYGFLFLLIQALLIYMKKNFHPEQTDYSRSLSVALKRYDEIRDSDGFRPLLDKVSHRKSVYSELLPHFFKSIERYDDPWLIVDGKRLLNLTSYSYLGLSQNDEVKQACMDGLQQGTSTQAVRLLGGNLSIHQRLEKTIANTFCRDDAIVFSSGYMTNFSVITSLMTKDDIIFADELVHASIVDGCRLSRAKIFIFPHNDMKTLGGLIELIPDSQKKLIVVDGVYSMDGDLCPLPDLLQLRDKFENTLIMMDDAHGLGVMGPDARGTESHFGLNGSQGVDLLMGTLSKSVPATGGYVTGRQDFIDHIRYNARSNIFSASMPPHIAATALKSFQLISQFGQELVRKSFQNKNKLELQFKELNYEFLETPSVILPLMIREERAILNLCRQLFDFDVYALPVVYPAVKRGEERIRIMVNGSFEDKHIEQVGEAFYNARNRMKSHHSEP